MEANLVYANGAVALTNSILVAKKFEKDHQHILRDIRNLMEGVSKIGDTPMFEETTYIHPQNGQEYPMFIMNRDGFTLLAMGFTGDKALRFKLDYINAFNKMEAELKSTKPLTQGQMLVQMAQAYEAQERMLLEQQRRQSIIEHKVEVIENRIENNGFMSVMGFANIHHLNIGTKAAAAIGRLASKWCKRNLKRTEKTKHERWGEVNTYPMEALRVCFAEFYPDKTF